MLYVHCRFSSNIIYNIKVSEPLRELKVIILKERERENKIQFCLFRYETKSSITVVFLLLFLTITISALT